VAVQSQSYGWWRKNVQVARRRKKTRTGWWLLAAESGWVGGGFLVNGREWLTLL